MSVEEEKREGETHISVGKEEDARRAVLPATLEHALQRLAHLSSPEVGFYAVDMRRRLVEGCLREKEKRQEAVSTEEKGRT